MRKLIVLACSAVLVLTGSAIAAPSGVFRQAHEYGFGDKSSLDPSSKGKVFQITEKIMNRLVRPDMDGKPAPDLALSWQPNAETTEWTFRLRPGVKFHNGAAFTADDVVYSLNRILDPNSDNPARSTISMITKVEAVDATTVKMTLNAPTADLPLQFTDYRIMMIPNGSGDTIGKTGIGTGPFKVVKFDPAGTTVLEANMDYYDGPPGVARMEIIAIPDAQARLQAALAGQTDMEAGITAQQKIMFADPKKYQIQEVPTGNWRGIVFRADSAPFTDLRVRKALRLAADRQAMLDLVEAGNGVLNCDTPVGPKDQYRADLKCPQDIDQAKKLLAEAGFPNGLDVEVFVATIEPTWPAMVEAYQSQAAAAGIRVKITKVPSDGFWTNVWMKKDATVTRWNDRPADQGLHEIYGTGSKWNESFYSDKEFDDLIDNARREKDFEKRKALYVKAQARLFESASTLVPYTVTKMVAASARVHNLDAVENFSIRWNKVTVDN
jgi:peptide/nickel transport system substrate-binding protein